MSFLGSILILALNIYSWIVIAEVVIHWLVAFDVFKLSNPQAANLVRLLKRATDPVYKHLRKYIPPIAGMDISPIILIFGIMILQQIIARLFIVPSYYH